MNVTLGGTSAVGNPHVQCGERKIRFAKARFGALLRQKIQYLLFAVDITITLPVLAGVETWTEPQTGIQWGYRVVGKTAEVAYVPRTVSGNVSIPSTIMGLPVTRIGACAFRECADLTSVTIPAGVIRIGRGAFASCTALTSVSMPPSVTSIGSSAFEDCQSLTTIAVPDALSHVGEAAFRGCAGLRRNGLVIINGVLYDGIDCSGDLVVPYGVTSIGYGVFSSYPYSGGSYVSSQLLFGRWRSVQQGTDKTHCFPEKQDWQLQNSEWSNPCLRFGVQWL